jgi:hypothetical protein
MVKLLIYSSKELYDKAPFDGRAEADVIAYRSGDAYKILKNRTSHYMAKEVISYTMERILEWVERDEWKRDLESHKLIENYKDHPYTTLMKNETDV